MNRTRLPYGNLKALSVVLVLWLLTRNISDAQTRMPLPWLEYLDSVDNTGLHPSLLHEVVIEESIALMGEGNFQKVEALFDTAAMFCLLENDYDNAGRHLMSKSEMLNMLARTEEALQVLHPISNWKVGDSVMIQFLIARGSLLKDFSEVSKGKVDLLKAENLIQSSGIHIFEHVLYFELSEMAKIEGSWVESIEYALKALRSNEELQIPYYEVGVLRLLGTLFRNIGNVEKSRYYYEAALYMAETEDLYLGQIGCIDALGTLYYDEGILDSARLYFEEALDLVEEGNSPRKYTWLRARLANVYLDMDSIEAAKRILPMVVDGEINLPRVEDSLAVLQARSNYLAATKRPEEALDLVKEMLFLSQKKTRPIYHMSALKMGIEIYDQLSLEEEKKKMERSLQILEDSLFQIRQSHELHNLEATYQDEKNTEKLMEVQLESDRRKKMLTLYASISLVLIVLVGLFIYLLRMNRRKSRLLKAQNETITAVLNEKEVLLKEIHHRVKNNLQIVSSMLRMQSRGMDDPSAQLALKESEQRIHSMALIHQDLYQEDDLSGIDVPTYIDKLLYNIEKSMNLNSEEINVQKSVAQLRLDIDTVIPLGLIINELLTNAFKYAFADKREGNIKVELFEKEEKLHLVVSDDGHGAGAIASSNSTQFGTKIINALARKLKAEVLIDDEQGFTTHMVIHKYKKVA